ncbi:MAG: hypothetical protein ICV84_11510 [Flavisolibacter sp.]|nr:hypothetical protein [Flavisolibacter sp.]
MKEHRALPCIARAKPCTATPAPQRQNPGREQYVKVILEHRKAILALSSYLVVDGCFMKKDFIAPLLQKACMSLPGLVVLPTCALGTREKQKVRSRKRAGDGRINSCHPDGRRLPLIASDRENDVFAGGVCCCVWLKHIWCWLFLSGTRIKNR